MPWANALDLADVLVPVYEFLKNHPTETVVFVVKQEGSDVIMIMAFVIMTSLSGKEPV